MTPAPREAIHAASIRLAEAIGRRDVATVREILAPYCHWQGALVAQGPDIEVTQNQAVLLSLLINELATNATKYGAWSVPSGQVVVTWREAEGETEGGREGVGVHGGCRDRRHGARVLRGAPGARI